MSGLDERATDQEERIPGSPPGGQHRSAVRGARVQSAICEAVRNIGMSPAIRIAGIFSPTAATIRPMLAVSVYPGATDEIPSTAPEKVPTLPDARPLETSPADSSATFSSLSRFAHGRSPALS